MEGGLVTIPVAWMNEVLVNVLEHPHPLLVVPSLLLIDRVFLAPPLSGIWRGVRRSTMR